MALYRVSNFGNRHGPGRGVPDTYRNYLGLALLDRDLNILRDEQGDYLDAVHAGLSVVRQLVVRGRGEGRSADAALQLVRHAGQVAKEGE